jgi:hypothetical protein
MPVPTTVPPPAVSGVDNTVSVEISLADSTTRFERHPFMYRGKEVPEADDGLYCNVKMVFAPSKPDPESRYSIKFVGGYWRSGVTVGRAAYGQLDRPGYGSSRMTIQTCRSAADPPEKDCPEWEN